RTADIMDAVDQAPADSTPTTGNRAGKLTSTPNALARVFGWLLVGDFAFVLIDQIGPRVMPVILKQHGVSDMEIAFIVGSIPSILMMLINPVVSYRSDRTRSLWGRRIPFLAWATPFVSLFLAITPFAPDLARIMGGDPWLSGICRGLSVSPIALAFGVFVCAFQAGKCVVTPVFFSLVRDVVPVGQFGRFMSLFRVVAALGTFVLTFWLLSHVETHAKAVFSGVAALNLVVFAAVCWFVKEGEHPIVVDKVATNGGRKGLWYAVRNYCSECFSSPLYWWMYGARLFVNAVAMLMGFLIFFPQYELGLGLETSARLSAWPFLVWLLFAYPVGLLLDRWGSIRVFSLALWLNVAAYLVSFFVVTGERSFAVSTLFTGLLFCMVMLAQTVFSQTIIHPQRIGQLTSANAMLQSIAIVGVISPLVGWFLSAMKGYHAVMHWPLIGAVKVGPYRFIHLIMAVLFLAAVFCLERARREWRKFGGPDAYRAPL
ncbi:MAG: MFS transporter, partial [Lacunisphaera sp.]|nr:MFS transporter [Lacunisphaera sp.]